LAVFRNAPLRGFLYLFGIFPPAMVAAYCQHYSRLHSTGALYWEIAEGLSDTVRFYVDYHDKTAHEIVCPRNIQYVVCSTRAAALSLRHYSAYGYAEPDGVMQTLAYRVAAGTS